MSIISGSLSALLVPYGPVECQLRSNSARVTKILKMDSLDSNLVVISVLMPATYLCDPHRYQTGSASGRGGEYQIDV